MILKKILPLSLFGRFLLIIILPTIFIQSIAIYIFYSKHWDNVSKHMSLSLAGEIALITNKYQASAITDEKSKLIELANEHSYLQVSTINAPIVNDLLASESLVNYPHTFVTKKRRYKKNIEKLKDVLNSKISHQFIIDTNNDKNLTIYILLKDNHLMFNIPLKRINSPSTYIFITWVVVTTIFFTLISIMFMRNQIRSIVNISVAAEKYSKNKDYIGFKPSGALEVRQVAKSFILMKNRLKRHVEQRTEFLAGVSHDLKTPLTRIKLHLGLLDENEDIEELKQDVIEMERMIDGYLQFAKGTKKQVPTIIDTSNLLKTTILNYKKTYPNITLNIKSISNININCNSLKRVLNNLLDNSIRYADNIEVNVELRKKYLIINIEDDGTGIPEDKRELVFRPFYRIDESRHLESANTGLGLSIAKDIITRCNGSIELGVSDMGGLKTTLKLPI